SRDWGQRHDCSAYRGSTGSVMPSPWLYHFWRLLLRSWDSLVSHLGTTTFGILFSVALMGCTLAYSFRSTLQHDHAKVTVAALKDAARQALRPMLAGMGIIVLGWLILLSVFVARTVYEDHETLVSVNKRLRLEAQSKMIQMPTEAKDPPRKLELALPRLLEQYLINRAKEDAGFESLRTASAAELPPGARKLSFTQRRITPTYRGCGGGASIGWTTGTSSNGWYGSPARLRTTGIRRICFRPAGFAWLTMR